MLVRANEHADYWLAGLVRLLSDAAVGALQLLCDAHASKPIVHQTNRICWRGFKKSRSLVCALALIFLVVAISMPAAAQQRRAVWVFADESLLGVNVVLDDGRVVSYRNVLGVTGPRIIPGLENIVATTARLALRRDGEVFTWRPKCGGHTLGPGDVENSFCEFPRARSIPGLRNIVAIAEKQKTYFALDRDGAVWGWGDDSNGQISGKPAVPQEPGKYFKRRIVKSLTRIPLPVPMASLSDFGRTVDRDGYIWMWGHVAGSFDRTVGNDFVGPNGFVARRIDGLPPVKSVNSSHAITRSGEVWRWVAEGLGSDGRAPVPTRIVGLGDIVAISSHYGSLVTLDKDGVVLFESYPESVDRFNKMTEDARGTKMPRAKFISDRARITTDGAVFLLGSRYGGDVQRLDLGK